MSSSAKGGQTRRGFPDWLVRRLEGELPASGVDQLDSVARRFGDLRVDLFPEGDRDRLRAVIAYSESGVWVASEGIRTDDTNPITAALHRLVEKVSEKTRDSQPAAEGSGRRPRVGDEGG